MKTYVLKAEIEQDEDGRWGAAVPALPGCATWGYTGEEALEPLREADQAQVEDIIEAGEVITTGGVDIGDLEIIEAPADSLIM